MPNLPSKPTGELTRARQKVILIVLSMVLTFGGFVVLLVLRRMPLPMRIVVGFGDFVAASALLLFLRQNYSNR